MVTIKDYTIQGVPVHIIGEDYAPEEIEQYVKRGRIGYSSSLIGMDIVIDGEFVDITHHLKPIPFERIRRVTGYLQTVKQFNNAKQAEERDRVKHG